MLKYFNSNSFSPSHKWKTLPFYIKFFSCIFFFISIIISFLGVLNLFNINTNHISLSLYTIKTTQYASPVLFTAITFLYMIKGVISWGLYKGISKIRILAIFDGLFGTAFCIFIFLETILLPHPYFPSAIFLEPLLLIPYTFFMIKNKY